jgi:hypothetical protein
MIYRHAEEKEGGVGGSVSASCFAFSPIALGHKNKAPKTFFGALPLFIYLRCKKIYMGNTNIEGVNNNKTTHPSTHPPTPHPSPILHPPLALEPLPIILSVLYILQ